MTALLNLRTAITQGIHGRIPDLKSCDPHPGRFDMQELHRVSTKTPTLRLAILGINRVAEVGNGEADWAVGFVAYLVTKDEGTLARDHTALNLIEGLIATLPGQTWGQDNAHPIAVADIDGGQNLYSNRLGKNAVSIWAVTFKQTIRMGCDILAADGTLPSKLYVGTAPKIGAAHKKKYDRVRRQKRG